MDAQQNVPDLLVLYGSQTGNSQTISQRITKELQTRFPHLKIQWLCTDKYTTVAFDKLRYLIVVISSTGQGDPPDNAISFVRWLTKLPEGQFKGLKYALLGLGDSNYDTFQVSALFTR